MADAVIYVLLVLAVVQTVLVVVVLVRRQAGGSGITTSDLDVRLNRLDAALRDELGRNRQENSAAAVELRGELQRSMKDLGELLGGRIREGAEAQGKANDAFGMTLSRTLTESSTKVETLRLGVEEKFEAFRDNTIKNLMTFGNEQQARFNSADLKDAEQAAGLRQELVKLHESLSGTLLQRVGLLNAEMTTAWVNFKDELSKLSAAQQVAMETLRNAVSVSLTEMRADNEKRLEEMRKTVDEKLQSTLETRLGEKFGEVRETLDKLNIQLVEVKRVDASVKDLTKVLGNVKTRGIWGEIQLGALLEQMLSAEQYETNVATASKGNPVEFAIKFPGDGEDGGHVWMPIDSKFPIEDYQRLIAAQDAADVEGLAGAGKALENRIWSCAKDIFNKYIRVPATTNFAVMYLPIEGLYAEVVRRPGLVEELQRDCRVMVAGPTTLAALLNSLQMGFRTLAIRQRTSEIEKLLGAVRTQFEKYGDLVEAVRNNLESASKNLDKVGDRTRQINKRLVGVERLTDDEARKHLPEPVRLIDEKLDEPEAT